MKFIKYFKNFIPYSFAILYAFLFTQKWHDWIFIVGIIFSFIFIFISGRNQTLTQALKKIFINVTVFAILLGLYFIFDEIILNYERFLQEIKIRPQNILSNFLFITIYFFFWNLTALFILEISIKLASLINRTILKKINKSIFLKKIFQSIIIFFAIIGLLVLIAIINYKFMFTFLGNSSPASQSFGYVLADKIKMDELKMYDKFRYETKNIPENNITGTFCIDLRADNLDKKSEINLLSENQTEKSGILIVNGQKKKASLDTKNNKINISTLSKPWHWHWYNWLGIGIDKVEKQSLEEKVNSPI